MTSANGLDLLVMSNFVVSGPQTPLTSIIIMDALCHVNMGLRFHNSEIVPISDVIVFYCRHHCLF